MYQCHFRLESLHSCPVLGKSLCRVILQLVYSMLLPQDWLKINQVAFLTSSLTLEGAFRKGPLEGPVWTWLYCLGLTLAVALSALTPMWGLDQAPVLSPCLTCLSRGQSCHSGSVEVACRRGSQGPRAKAWSRVGVRSLNTKSNTWPGSVGSPGEEIGFCLGRMGLGKGREQKHSVHWKGCFSHQDELDLLTG